MEGCRNRYCDPVDLHLAMVNYAVRKHTNVRARGEPAVKIHFTPTHASWMNLVEVWSGIVERRAIRRQVFKSLRTSTPKSGPFVDGWNDRSHPFVWTKTAGEIPKKANRRTTSSAPHAVALRRDLKSFAGGSGFCCNPSPQCSALAVAIRWVHLSR